MRFTCNQIPPILDLGPASKMTTANPCAIACLQSTIKFKVFRSFVDTHAAELTPVIPAPITAILPCGFGRGFAELGGG